MSPGQTVFVVGLAVAGLAWALGFGVLISYGGFAKSRQFKVFAGLLRAEHGKTPQRLTVGALAGTLLGVLIIFTGVGLKDAERDRRCRLHCAAAGYERGVIGPSQRVHPTRRNLPAFVACTCRGGKEPELEQPADSLE